MSNPGKPRSPSDQTSKPKARRTRPPRKKLDMSPGRIKQWFREMRSELKKVVWPTPKQVMNNSIIVAVAVLVVGTVIAVYDFGLEELVKFVIVVFNPGSAATPAG